MRAKESRMSIESPTLLPNAETEIQDRIRSWKQNAEIEFFPRFNLPQLYDQIGKLNHPISISSPSTMAWDVAFEYAREIKLRTGADATFHSAWRKVTSELDAADKMKRMQDAGLNPFFIAGDDKNHAGSFQSTIHGLETLERQGIRFNRIGFPAYPYDLTDAKERGHSFISNSDLKTALFAKQAYAEKTGTEAYVVMQLQFYIEDIASWITQMRKEGLHLPIYASIMAPISFPNLIGYIKRCGLANAQRIIRRFPNPITMISEFARGYNPNPLLYDLAKEHVDIQGIVVTSTNRLPQTIEFLNT